MVPKLQHLPELLRTFVQVTGSVRYQFPLRNSGDRDITAFTLIHVISRVCVKMSPGGRDDGHLEPGDQFRMRRLSVEVVVHRSRHATKTRACSVAEARAVVSAVTGGRGHCSTGCCGSRPRIAHWTPEVTDTGY